MRAKLNGHKAHGSSSANGNGNGNGTGARAQLAEDAAK